MTVIPVSLVDGYFRVAPRVEPFSGTMEREAILVAVTMFTLEPTDRALAGWSVFGEGHERLVDLEDPEEMLAAMSNSVLG